MSLFNNSGTENFDRLRPLMYPNTAVFIVCTLLGDSEHLLLLKDRWFPEIHRFNDTTAPIILVGVRPGSNFHDDVDVDVCDETPNRIRQDNLPSQRLNEGENLAKMVGAWKYLECDMTDLASVDAVFHQVAHRADSTAIAYTDLLIRLFLVPLSLPVKKNEGIHFEASSQGKNLDCRRLARGDLEY